MGPRTSWTMPKLEEAHKWFKEVRSPPRLMSPSTEPSTEPVVQVRVPRPASEELPVLLDHPQYFDPVSDRVDGDWTLFTDCTAMSVQLRSPFVVKHLKAYA